MNVGCELILATKPLGEIKKATDSAIKTAEEFKDLFQSKIKVN